MKTTRETKPKSKGRNKGWNNLIPLKPGETANPNGRPKGQRNYETIYREALIKLADLNGKKPDELETEMLSKAIGLARGGNFAFYKDTMDRLYGQATAKTEVKTQNNQIVNINFFSNPKIMEATRKLDEAVKEYIISQDETEKLNTTIQDK